MQKKDRVSLKDIAKVAGVSIITVSRALDPMRSNSISIATRDRICKLADKMNYSSNLAARRFKKGRSEVINVVLPQNILRKPETIDFSGHGHFLLWEIIKGITNTAKYWKYDIKLEILTTEEDQSGAIIETLSNPYSDGAILIGIYNDYSEIIPALQCKKIPYLLLSPSPSMQTDIHEISFDLSSGFRAALEYIIHKKARKKIAVLHYEALNTPRLLTSREILREAGLYDETLFFKVISFDDLHKLVAKRRNKALFDAVLCYNDTMAFYLVKELRKCTSLRVPEDISVLGYDNNPTYEEMDLSTLALPRFELGCEGVNTLVNMLEGKERSSARKMLNVRFKEGSTC